MGTDNLQILVVEDDEVDILTLLRAFKKLGFDRPVVIARDGIEALQIMRGEHPEKEIASPYVVLADLNMPRMNGLELLAEIRKDPELFATSVFILSTSRHPTDLTTAHKHNVAGYLRKPLSFDEYQCTVEALKEYWSLCHFI
mgnify:CR=1 FL=1